MEQKLMTTKELFTDEKVKAKFKELLGKKAQGFITSVLQIVAGNPLLQKATPNSIYNAAAIAATLDLPINNNLGFAYIIPYKAKNKDGQYEDVAQFQLGYKGFIQLAQRSGQFLTIGACPIMDGQLIESNPLTGFKFDFTKKSSIPIGYAAYFRLLNGFEKTLYMTVTELEEHGKEFSQTFKKGYGLWKDNFEAMAIKTVIKLLLSKYAPLSIDMQRAVITDQAVIENADTMEVSYVDNSGMITEEQKSLILGLVSTSTFDESQRTRIEQNVDAMNQDEATDTINDLKGNQLDAIASGTGYNQTDIKNKLNTTSH